MLIVGLALIISGCAITEKKPADTAISMSASEVKVAVKGWAVYTNPALRYELRHPKKWDFEDNWDGSKIIEFKDGDDTIMKITGVANWREKYTLEEYYENQPVNLFSAGYQNEEVQIGGRNATWFKNVTEPGIEMPVNVFGMFLDDRIMEIHVYDEWDDSLVVINSLKFYGNNIISDLETN